jgi:hypothetical protein
MRSVQSQRSYDLRRCDNCVTTAPHEEDKEVEALGPKPPGWPPGKRPGTKIRLARHG